MSSTSEESPTNHSLEALESLYAAQRRPIERSEPRLASLNDTPFARPPKLETARPMTAPGDRLETAMAEFVRRQIKPEAVPDPLDFKPAGTRRVLMASAIGLSAAVAALCFVALLFVNVFPRQKDALQSFAAIAATATSPSRQADDASKRAPSQFRALLATDSRGENFTHEQSERLLQQFVQWRQKTALAGKP